MRTVAPPGDCTSAASPCPTSRNRTTSPLGGPARSAVVHTKSGSAAATATTSTLGTWRPLRSHTAIATTMANPRNSTLTPPADVTLGIGELAR